MKILNVIESAYRATSEEQDDTIVWISHALKGAGADLAVLLRGNAVNYAVGEQATPALTFGDWTQSHPPALAKDIQSLIDKGASVYLVRDDAGERGLEGTELLPGVTPIARTGLPALFDQFDAVWHW